MIYSVKLMNYGRFCKKKTSGYGAGAAGARPRPRRGPKIQPGQGPLKSARAAAFKVSRGEGPRRGKPRAPEDTGKNPNKKNSFINYQRVVQLIATVAQLYA